MKAELFFGYARHEAGMQHANVATLEKSLLDRLDVDLMRRMADRFGQPEIRRAVELVARSRTTAQAGLLVREYLQARVLEGLQHAGAFSSWAFVGGTALRFLYGLPRFSEDLDFSKTGVPSSVDQHEDEFRRFIARVRSTFESEAYKVDIRARVNAVVQSAFVGFPGLPHELGLSPQAPRPD